MMGVSVRTALIWL